MAVQQKRSPKMRARIRKSAMPEPARQQILEAVWLQMDRVIAEWSKYPSKKRSAAIEKTFKWTGGGKGAAKKIEKDFKALKKKGIDPKRAFREAACRQVAAAMQRLATAGALDKFVKEFEAGQKGSKGKKKKGVRGLEGDIFTMDAVQLSPGVFRVEGLGLGELRDGSEGRGIYGFSGGWYGAVAGLDGFFGDIAGSIKSIGGGLGRVVTAVVKPLVTVTEGLSDILQGNFSKGIKKIILGATRDLVLGPVVAVVDLMKQVACSPLAKMALGIGTIAMGAYMLPVVAAGGTVGIAAAGATASATSAVTGAAAIAGSSIGGAGLVAAGAGIGYQAGKLAGNVACGILGGIDKGMQGLAKATGGDYRGKKSKTQQLQERLDMYEELGEPYGDEATRQREMELLMSNPQRLQETIAERTWNEIQEQKKSKWLLYGGIGLAGLAVLGGGYMLMKKPSAKKPKTKTPALPVPPPPSVIPSFVDLK